MLAVTLAQLLKGRPKIWRSLALVQLAAIFPFPPLSLPCVVLHLAFHWHYHGTQTISIGMYGVSYLLVEHEIWIIYSVSLRFDFKLWTVQQQQPCYCKDELFRSFVSS